MSKAEELHVMDDFIKEDLNAGIKKELTNALKRDNPIRNYLQIIENDEGLTAHWLNFKRAWYQEWVRGYYFVLPGKVFPQFLMELSQLLITLLRLK